MVLFEKQVVKLQREGLINVTKDIRWIWGLRYQAPSVYEVMKLKATSCTPIHFVSLFAVVPGSIIMLFSPAKSEVPSFFWGCVKNAIAS